ncbi:MAG: YeeE/YedE thiosulfate transporter family protein [Gemmatimonadaceae bacterium]
MSDRAPRPYSDPYLTGVALGLVLLAAYVFAGRGLGASGAFATVAAGAVNATSPGAARANFWFADHLDAGSFWRDWLVVELAGVVIGAWISAKLAHRVQLVVERGAGTTVRGRVAAAASGGAVMGVGAVLARGCTSGQALTGGALLSVGSWTFIAGAFGAAYVVAFVRRGAWS